MAAELAFDIEVVAPRWIDLDERTRLYLGERAQKQHLRDGLTCTYDESERLAADRLALEMGMGKIVAIGLHNLDTGGSWLLLEGEPFDAPGTSRGPEKQLLKEFWAHIRKAGRLISFNGRGYDGPMLMIRSAFHGIPCPRQLVGFRFDLKDHCDIADCLAFWGSVRQGYSLDYWCRRAGIESPKAEGTSGSDVQRLYEEGRLDLIGEYVLRDVRATAELYVKLKPMLMAFNGGPRYEQPALQQVPA